MMKWHCNRNLKKLREEAMQVSEKRLFQGEKTAGAKVQRLEQNMCSKSSKGLVKLDRVSKERVVRNEIQDTGRGKMTLLF